MTRRERRGGSVKFRQTTFALVPSWVQERVRAYADAPRSLRSFAIELYAHVACKHCNFQTRAAGATEAELAAELEISEITVRRAIRLLRGVGAFQVERGRFDDGTLDCNVYILPIDPPNIPAGQDQRSGETGGRDQGKDDVSAGDNQRSGETSGRDQQEQGVSAGQDQRSGETGGSSLIERPEETDTSATPDGDAAEASKPKRKTKGLRKDDPHFEMAEKIAKWWWEERPKPVGSYVALRNNIGKFLAAGVEPRAIAKALQALDVTVPTVQQLERQITRGGQPTGRPARQAYTNDLWEKDPTGGWGEGALWPNQH